MGKENRKKVILNATPVIYLGKTNVLKKVVEVFNEIYITEAVYDEVVERGKELGAEEVYIVEKYIKDRAIKVIGNPSATDDFSETYQLGKGESSTILAAMDKKCIAIVDDERARKIGEKCNVEIHGMLFLLKLLLLLKKLNRTEIENVVKEMTNKGFRLDAYIILIFVEDIKIESSEKQ